MWPALCSLSVVAFHRLANREGHVVEVVGRHRDPVFGAAAVVFPLGLAHRPARVNQVAGSHVVFRPFDDVLVEDRHFVPERVRLELAVVVLAAILGRDADPKGGANFLDLTNPANGLKFCKSSHCGTLLHEHR